MSNVERLKGRPRWRLNKKFVGRVGDLEVLRRLVDDRHELVTVVHQAAEHFEVPHAANKFLVKAPPWAPLEPLDVRHPRIT